MDWIEIETLPKASGWNIVVGTTKTRTLVWVYNKDDFSSQKFRQKFFFSYSHFFLFQFNISPVQLFQDITWSGDVRRILCRETVDALLYFRAFFNLYSGLSLKMSMSTKRAIERGSWKGRVWVGMYSSQTR